MPVIVEWYTPEHTILYHRFIAPWTWEEYAHSEAQTRTLLDTVPHKVDLILDFKEMGRLPGNTFMYLRQSAITVHANQGIVVIIGVNVLLRMIGSIMENLYPRAAKDRFMAKDLSDALRIIAEVKRSRSQSTT
ncbi:MAG: hypothetical protein U0694_29565 [Anaerolineae bacterium]